MLSLALLAVGYCYAQSNKGESVVDRVVPQVERCLGSTKNFMKRIAYVESQFGLHRSTYRRGYHGGIWQVDRVGFEDTQNVAAHPGLPSKFNKIKRCFGIDWQRVSWSQLRDPLYSAIAARLFLLNKPGAIPSTLSGQAAYWKKHYNSGIGHGSVQDFINRWNTYVSRKG